MRLTFGDRLFAFGGWPYRQRGRVFNNGREYHVDIGQCPCLGKCMYVARVLHIFCPSDLFSAGIRSRTPPIAQTVYSPLQRRHGPSFVHPAVQLAMLSQKARTAVSQLHRIKIWMQDHLGSRIIGGLSLGLR